MLIGEAHLCLSPSPGADGSVCASDLHKEERSIKLTPPQPPLSWKACLRGNNNKKSECFLNIYGNQELKSLKFSFPPMIKSSIFTNCSEFSFLCVEELGTAKQPHLPLQLWEHQIMLWRNQKLPFTDLPLCAKYCICHYLWDAYSIHEVHLISHRAY